LVECAAHGLALQRQHFTAQHRAHALRPARKTIGKLFWVQRLEEAVESVVAGHAAAQREEGAQPFQAHAGELLHVIKTLAAAQAGAQRDDEQFDQIMFTRAGDAWVGHLAQNGNEADDFGFGNVVMLKHPASCTHCIYKVHQCCPV